MSFNFFSLIFIVLLFNGCVNNTSKAIIISDEDLQDYLDISFDEIIIQEHIFNLRKVNDDEPYIIIGKNNSKKEFKNELSYWQYLKNDPKNIKLKFYNKLGLRINSCILHKIKLKRCKIKIEYGMQIIPYQTKDYYQIKMKNFINNGEALYKGCMSSDFIEYDGYFCEICKNNFIKFKEL